MKNIKKGILLGLCGIIAVSALSGCSGKKVEEKESVSISIFDRGQIAADEGSYEENRWTKQISEKSGMNIKWIPIPRNEVRQKLNMLIAAGDAPDLMWDYDRDYIGQLVAQDAIMPIDELLEKSTVYKDYLEKNPDLKPYIMFDGKTYAITSKRPNVANYGAWIRKDWLDKLGLKAPKTDEELLAVAKAFKDGDPDGNGISDTIPFALSGNDVIYNFYNIAKNNWYLENGKMVYGALTDRFVDAIRFKQRAYKEGLIDPEFITDTNNQRQQQNFTTGKAGIYLNAWDIKPQYVALKQNDPNAEPVP
ncbi:MAG: extracellular solute-binding protein, partial [Oscillospiraceae bacterium]